MLKLDPGQFFNVEKRGSLKNTNKQEEEVEKKRKKKKALFLINLRWISSFADFLIICHGFIHLYHPI